MCSSNEWRICQQGYQVWKYDGRRLLPFDTNAQREEFDDKRYRRNSPYMKLKMVMDYWCSLFFWEFEDANNLPTRQQYWKDIERLLDVDIKQEVSFKFSNADKTGMEDLFKPKQGSIVFDDAEERVPKGEDMADYWLNKAASRPTAAARRHGTEQSLQYCGATGDATLLPPNAEFLKYSGSAMVSILSVVIRRG
jgi:hypothetical protein